MSLNQPESVEQNQPAAAACYWHPDIETGLSCSRCDKAICPQCLVQAPVGIRCRECGKAQPMPTYDVRPANYLRGFSVALLLVIGGGIVWSLLDFFMFTLGAFGSVSGMLAIPAGLAFGELISLSVNRKRSPLLSYIAALSVLGAFLVSRIIHLIVGSGVGLFGLWELAFLFIGAFLAWQRLRR